LKRISGTTLPHFDYFIITKYTNGITNSTENQKVCKKTISFEKTHLHWNLYKKEKNQIIIIIIQHHSTSFIFIIHHHHLSSFIISFIIIIHLHRQV